MIEPIFPNSFVICELYFSKADPKQGNSICGKFSTSSKSEISLILFNNTLYLEPCVIK